MTNEEVKDELYRLKSDIRTDYPLRTIHQKERFMQSIDIAIKSLEMWDKIVEQINTKYGHILKATKYGNKGAEQQSFSYSNVLMYEVADILDDIEGYNEEYRKEIEGE